MCEVQYLHIQYAKPGYILVLHLFAELLMHSVPSTYDSTLLGYTLRSKITVVYMSYTHTHIHIHTNAHIRTYMLTHMHIHMYTHT